MTRERSLRWRADGALVLLALLWGGTFVVVKAALQDVSTMYFLLLRFALAAVCMGLLFARSFARMSTRELWRGVWGGAIVGLFLWLGFALQTWGLEYTTASNSGFLTGLYIVLVPLFSAAVYRRWPRPAELVGIAVAGVGLVLLTAPSARELAGLNRGDLLTIGCAIVFAFHLLVLGYFSQRERYEAIATAQVASTALISGMALPFEPLRVHWNGAVVLAVVITGLFATALAFSLQTWAQRYTSPTRAALILSLEPVFAFVAAVLVAGEVARVRSVLGGAAIVGGILIVELRK